MGKIKTSISLEENIYNQIKEIALKEDRSFSQQVQKILKEFIENNKNRA